MHKGLGKQYVNIFLYPNFSVECIVIVMHWLLLLGWLEIPTKHGYVLRSVRQANDEANVP
jgi:hypothetical protein